MSGWPDNGGLFPEGQVEDPTPDDRRERVDVCKRFTFFRPHNPHCLFCQCHRSDHFGHTIEAATGGEWTRYATLLESKRRGRP